MLNVHMWLLIHGKSEDCSRWTTPSKVCPVACKNVTLLQLACCCVGGVQKNFRVIYNNEVVPHV
jgi:hypothetical protein